MHERLDQIERNLLYFAVFLSPMRELRPTDINITYSDVIFCVLAGMMLVRRRLQTTPLQDVTIIWMIANLCLIGGLFASSIINGSAAASLVVGTQYMFAYVFLPFVVLRDQETALALVKVMVFASLFVVVCGFGFVATGYHGGFRYISGSGRLMSFASNPNEFAMMIAMSVPMLLYLWFVKALSGVTSLVIAICLFIGLVLASSNSGIGGTVVGIAAFFLFLGRVRSMLVGVMVGGLMITAAATVGYEYLPEVFQNRVLSAVESGNIEGAGTYADRMELIVEASEMLEDSLLLGIGADQYRERSYWGEAVHNQYLLVWIEGGTIALLGWMLILITMAIVGIRAYQRQGGAPEAAMVLAVLIIIMIVGTTSPHLYARAWVVPLLVAIGVPLSRQVVAAAGPPKRSEPASSSPPQKERKALPYRPAMHAQIRYSQRR